MVWHDRPLLGAAGKVIANVSAAAMNARRTAIRLLPGSLSDAQSPSLSPEVDRFGLDCPTRLTSPVLPHREAGVIAALPMQQQLDLIIFDARHGLAQHSTDDALARGGGRRRMMPGCLQVSTHLQQTLTLLCVQRRRTLSDHRIEASSLLCRDKMLNRSQK
jgi:hypothetical protein